MDGGGGRGKGGGGGGGSGRGWGELRLLNTAPELYMSKKKS